MRRYQDTVHSACRRRLADPVLAQDAAQTTFLLLAQRAVHLRGHASLGGWLYQTAIFQSSNLMRREQTRDRAHERLRQDPCVELHGDPSPRSIENQIHPCLDDALLELEEGEREAVTLRYFGNRSLRDIGAALNTTEEAARKRVSRALERLAGFLKRRTGTTVSSATLASLLSQSVEAAPADLLPSITASVHGASLLNHATASTVFWAKVKLITTIVAVGSLPLTWQWLSNRRLERKLAELQASSEAPVFIAPTVTPWEPAIERPGALSLTRPESDSPLLAMLAGVWAVESRRGLDSRLALLRERLQLNETQVEFASATLRRSQMERADLVQSIAQGDAQFENIVRFLGAEEAALEAIAAELTPAQSAGLASLRLEEAQQRAENLAHWRLADLESQFDLPPNQKPQAFAALVKHEREFDLERVNQLGSMAELLAWLENRRTSEGNILRANLTDAQFKVYQSQPDRARAMDVLRSDRLNRVP